MASLTLHLWLQVYRNNVYHVWCFVTRTTLVVRTWRLSERAFFGQSTEFLLYLLTAVAGVEIVVDFSSKKASALCFRFYKLLVKWWFRRAWLNREQVSISLVLYVLRNLVHDVEKFCSICAILCMRPRNLYAIFSSSVSETRWRGWKNESPPIHTKLESGNGVVLKNSVHFVFFCARFSQNLCAFVLSTPYRW